MQRRLAIGCLMLAAGLAGSRAAILAATPAGDVSVTVTYTGKSAVDETHEIWVFLFDTPNIDQDSRPIGVDAVRKSGGVATFKNVTADPVYVVMAYDEKGDYDGEAGPPPPGTPIGMHSTDGQSPSPVTPGPEAKIKVTFDDSRRMQE